MMSRLAALGVVAVMALAACTSSGDPKPSATASATAKVVAPKAGDCFADADSKLDPADPDLASRTKCTKPHLYEVTGVNPIPRRFLGTSGDNTRDQVLEQDAFAQYAGKTCSLQLWQALGVEAADVRSDQIRLSDIRAVPAATGLVFRDTITPEDAWSKREHQLICFVEFRGPDDGRGPGAAVTVTSYNLEPVFQKFLGSHFPTERRRCLLDSDDSRQESRPCSRAHDAEVILTFDARLAFGPSFVKDAMQSSPDDKVLERMAKLCTDILPGVLGSPIHDDLSVWISRGDTWDNGWDLSIDPENGVYPFPIDCHLRPSDPSLVLAPGTVVDSADYPELEDRSDRSDA